MSHPQQPSPELYFAKLQSIRDEAAPVLATIESGKFDWRDVAMITELLQRFADVLDEMECSPPRLKEFTWMT